MPTAFALAFAQLHDRRLIAILVKSLALTLVIFAGVGTGLWFALDRWTGQGAASALAATVAMLLLFWVAFRGVAIAVVGLFGDAVVAAVERRHYPEAAGGARDVTLFKSATMGLGSVTRLIGYNILAVPLYAAAAITGVGLPIAFLAVNGWLLGRDLGDMVAVRHLTPSELPHWRAQTRWSRFAAGLAASALFVVPGLNLLAPVVGAAAMTHLFHRGRRA